MVGDALAGLDGDRSDLALELAARGGVLRTLQRFDRIGVLLLAGKLVFTGDLVSEETHRAFGIGIGQAIEAAKMAINDATPYSPTVSWALTVGLTLDQIRLNHSDAIKAALIGSEDDIFKCHSKGTDGCPPH